MTLEQTIERVLRIKRVKLSASQIVRGVLELGYSTRSNDFATAVYRKIRQMQREGKVRVVKCDSRTNWHTAYVINR